MKPGFSWIALTGGLLLALLCGSLANVGFGLAAASMGAQSTFALMMLIPGAVIVLIAWRAQWRDGFGHGVIIGGCIIALAGGICGYTLASS